MHTRSQNRVGTSAAGVVTAQLAAWNAVDWILALYVTFVALVAVIWASTIPSWPYIVVGHGVLLAAIVSLPARGSAWESPRPADPRLVASTRAAVRFLRYTYPALLLTPFFEEVWLTINATSPQAPYWFEPNLYAFDRALFGVVPAVALSQAGGPLLDELMHAFYFSYYPLIIGGIVLAWTGGRRGRETPGPDFHTAMTCLLLGFFLSFVWYPFLPARGPWENPQIMEGLRPFRGPVFTEAIKLIISGAAVSGACFPSAHVSGAWALTFGLYRAHPRAACGWALVATGLSVSCMYTRYHHAADVLAGLTVASVAALIGYSLNRRARTPQGLPAGERRRVAAVLP